MREYRSGSQILFGHLPEQTVDADGGIWKVKRWNNPRVESAIDISALREELIRAAYPWKESDQDSGFVDDLYSQRTVRVQTLNYEDGIWCEPFPRLYLCRVCKRLHDEPEGRCECGSQRRRGQLPFVGYHDACGSIKSPYVEKCPTHRQIAVRFPGTASAAELVFYCPVPTCNYQKRGFGAACDCKQPGALSFTVHRSGTVFKPRGISMINPPRREVLNTIEQAGGGERALEWVLDGMQGRNVTDSAPVRNTDSIRKILEDRGFDAATIEAMVAAMPQGASIPSRPPLQLNPILKAEAERQAKQIALATFESRVTLTDLHARAESPALKRLYDIEYPAALAIAGLEQVELIDRFPVLTAQFGFTRGPSAPGVSRLRTYRDANGEYDIYGELSQTEALLIRLNPELVYQWLLRIGATLGEARDKRSAGEAILLAMNGTTEQATHVTRKVTELVHSYSHAFIKRAAVYAGIERSALSEVILPMSLSFFVYATARGSFVLGGLQALLESELHQLLSGIVDDEYRCALDPGCEDTGGACAVCLHLGEPSCQMFNTMLSRKTLSGGYGYFDVTTSVSAS